MNCDITIRKAKANSYCRGCDRLLKRNEDDVIYTYSMRNKGQNILFCFACLELMNNLHLEYLRAGEEVSGSVAVDKRY